MNLKTTGLLLLAVALLFTSCKSTKKVKNPPPPYAEPIETQTYDGTESNNAVDSAEPTEFDEDYDAYGDYFDDSEVFVTVPENEYISADTEDYDDIYSDYEGFEYGFVDDSFDDSLINNDYSDDYPAEEGEKTESANNSGITFGGSVLAQNTGSSNSSASSGSSAKEETGSSAASSKTETQTGSTTSSQNNSTDSGKKGGVNANQFYVDYNSPEYSDYSGYNYGDAQYNELVLKFGPNSFPSDKIMAPGRKSADQLYKYFASKNPNGDLKRAKELAKLYVEECAIEGVNSDLAFVQMCHETGFLRFGNLVTPDMNNFCGLGSVSKQNPGLSFPNDRMGVRAHVQHLQAYGSKAQLKQTLVDPRYKYVNPRGKAPTLAGLTGAWAADKNYDKKIYTFMKELAHF